MSVLGMLGWAAALVLLGALGLQSARLRQRRELVTRACHELRNPLTAARLMVASMQRRNEAPAARLDALPKAVDGYIESLRATREMTDVELVLTGHGDPISDPASIIDGRFGMYERRAEKFRGMLEKNGPQTAYEIAQATWGNVAVTQAFLTLSEVLGHMDLLLDDGRVVEERDGDVVRFRAV